MTLIHAIFSISICKMRQIEKRIILFLTFCIASRLSLAFLVAHVDEKFRKVLSLILSTIGLGFLIIYTFHLRKSGLETGGQPIWWDFMRPIHGTLFLVSSYLLWIGRQKYASLYLFMDVCIGLSAFLMHHFL